MSNLKHLGIDGNDVTNVRQDIIKCGPSRVLNYLRQNMPANENRLCFERICPFSPLRITASHREDIKYARNFTKKH